MLQVQQQKAQLAQPKQVEDERSQLVLQVQQQKAQLEQCSSREKATTGQLSAALESIKAQAQVLQGQSSLVTQLEARCKELERANKELAKKA